MTVKRSGNFQDKKIAYVRLLRKGQYVIEFSMRVIMSTKGISNILQTSLY